MRPRTAEANDALRAMNHLPSAIICAHFGITRAALSMWRKALGLTPPKHRKSDDHRGKIAAALRGRSPSAETRERLSAALSGRKRDPVAVARMAASRIANTQERAVAEVFWTDDLIGKLRAQWDEGHSAAEIGRRLGITKNAVVGKANRLNLPPRLSPIKAKGSGRRPHGVSTRRAVAVPVVHAAPAPLAIVPHVTNGRVKRTLAVEPVRERAPIPMTRPGTCCWPIGEPGRRGFRFCEAEGIVARTSYCVEHAVIAHPGLRRPEARDAA